MNLSEMRFSAPCLSCSRKLTCPLSPARGRQRNILSWASAQSHFERRNRMNRHQSHKGRRSTVSGRWSSLASTETLPFSAASTVAMTLEAAQDFIVDLKQSSTPGFIPMQRREDRLSSARKQQSAAAEAAQGLKTLVQNVRMKSCDWRS